MFNENCFGCFVSFLVNQLSPRGLVDPSRLQDLTATTKRGRSSSLAAGRIRCCYALAASPRLPRQRVKEGPGSTNRGHQIEVASPSRSARQ